MRSDKTGVPSYRFGKAAKNDFTVAQWRDQRFKSVYVGYEVTVWFQNGDPAHGATKLSTVRQSYLD